MKCGDLDKIRMASPDSRASAWGPEAQEHLRSCQRCAQLQVLLEGPHELAIPDALQSRIESALLPGLAPVSPIPSVLRVVAALLLGSLLVVVAANWLLGVKGWQARSGLQDAVDFCLLSLSILLVANTLAHWMMPGSRRSGSAWVYIVVPLIALMAADIALYGYRWRPGFVPLGLHCWEIGITCAALSAPLMWLALRRGASLRPVAQGATVGLLAGMVGVTVLDIYCNYLDRWHISVWHIGAAITSTLVGAAMGSVKGRMAS